MIRNKTFPIEKFNGKNLRNIQTRYEKTFINTPTDTTCGLAC